MMKVKVSFKEKEGYVEYDEATKKLNVVFDDPTIRKDIVKYLNTKRAFKIPESDVIDDYRIDQVKPVDNEMYFNLALSSMWSRNSVWVHWESEE